MTPKFRIGLYLAALFAVAVALRWIVLNDLAAHDPYFYSQRPGTDQGAYVELARRILAGTWGRETFYFQPLYPFILAGLQVIVGPNLYLVRLVQLLMASGGLLIAWGIAKRLFGARAAWLAAVLYTVYPVMIFYDLVLLVASLTTLIWLAMTTCVVRWVERGGARWAFLAGLFAGIAGGMQPTLSLAAFFPVAEIAWRDRTKAIWPVLAFLAALTIALAPYSLWNYHVSGKWSLISGSGGVNFYIGNNRNANGQRDRSLALEATEFRVRRGRTSYESAALEEIFADPFHAAQLFLRKIGMVWTNPELAQNVDYQADGLAHSPLLRSIPLNFLVIAAPGLAGLWLHRRDRRVRAMMLIALGATVSIALFFVSSRHRLPLMPALIIWAGAGVDRLIGAMQRVRQPTAGGRSLKEAGAAWGFTAAVLLAAKFAVDQLPRPPLVARVPNGYHSIGTVQGVAVFVPDSLPAVRLGEPYWIPVYWQADTPLGHDYRTLVQLIDANGNKWAQGDHAAGETTFPPYGASRWRGGQIVRDEFLILPEGEWPTPFTAWVWLGLYDEQGVRLPAFLPDGTPAAGNVLAAGPVAVSSDRLSVNSDRPAGFRSIGARIGSVTLAGYTAKPEADSLLVTLYWNVAEAVREDGVVFIHLFDSSGKFVAGQDGRPLGGRYWTNTWQAGEQIVDEHRVALLPDLPPGEYRLTLGVYEAGTQVRFSVTDAGGQIAPDGELTLGVVPLP